MGFVFKIYLGRQISTAALGAYTVSLSVAMVFVTILTSGLPLIISRNVASNNVGNKKQQTYKVVTAGLIISLITAILLSLIIIFGKRIFTLFFTDDSSYLMLLALIPFIVFSGLYAPIKGFLWGNEKYFEVSVVEFTEQIIKIIACIIMFSLLHSNNILPAGLAISFACVISTLIGYLFYKKKKGKFENPKGLFKPLLKSSFPLTLVRFIGSLLTPAIAIILPLRLIAGGFSNEQALSLIGITMGMTMPIISIPSTIVGSLSMALIPQLSVLSKEKNNYALKNQIKSSFLFSLIASFFILPIFMGIGTPICEFLFGNSEAGRLLVKFAWIIVPTGLMQISTSILNSLGKEVFTFITYAIGGIVLFIGIIFLPPLIGIDALLLCMGINAIIVSGLNYYKIYTITHQNYGILKNILLISIVCGALSLLCKYTFSLFIKLFPSFISIALVCGISCISFILLLISLNIIDGEYIEFAKKKVIKKHKNF